MFGTMEVESSIELSHEEIKRYARHLIIPEFGIEGQKKLKRARVLMIGAGGLGSPFAMYLAAAGIGHLGIVDYDTVDFQTCNANFFTVRLMSVVQKLFLQRRLFTDLTHM